MPGLNGDTLGVGVLLAMLEGVVDDVAVTDAVGVSEELSDWDGLEVAVWVFDMLGD